MCSPMCFSSCKTALVDIRSSIPRTRFARLLALMNKLFHELNFQAGVVTLQKLLIREKAGQSDSRGIYIISSHYANPEMYELKVQTPKDKNVWIQKIRAAVVQCPTDNSRPDDDMPADLKQRNIDEKQATIRELIGE